MTAQREHSGGFAWLHDDSEEDLVGSDWHQQAINALYASLNELLRSRTLPWHIGNQMALAAWRPDGRSWRPSPDIMIHAAAGQEKRREMKASADGVPDLIVEVASETTWAYDVDDTRGKAAGYLHLGVREYLVFDAAGEFLSAPCVAWRRDDGGARRWQPDADGRYISALGISLQPEGDLLRVYDPDGRPVPYEYEKSRIIADLEAELARLRER